MTHTDLLKTSQRHCFNKKFIHLQQRKPSTLGTMNWLIRIKKGLTRTKMDRKVTWSNLIRTSLWTVLLMPRKHRTSHIPSSKIWILESVPCVSVLVRFDCMLPRKEIHCRSIVLWQSITVFEAPHRYNTLWARYIQQLKLESRDNQTNLTHGFNIFWLTNAAALTVQQPSTCWMS